MLVKEIKALEYRLFEPENQYPAIYHIVNDEQSAIFCRRASDYFVWNKKVYEKVSSSVEEDVLVIYLKESEETPFQYSIPYTDLGIEVRLYEEEKESIYESFLTCQNHDDLYMYFASDYFSILGREYEILSRETDEDRKTFVVYVTKVQS